MGRPSSEQSLKLARQISNKSDMSSSGELVRSEKVDLTKAVVVQYETRDGRAVEDEDYVAVSGTLVRDQFLIYCEISNLKSGAME